MKLETIFQPQIHENWFKLGPTIKGNQLNPLNTNSALRTRWRQRLRRPAALEARPSSEGLTGASVGRPRCFVGPACRVAAFPSSRDLITSDRSLSLSLLFLSLLPRRNLRSALGESHTHTPLVIDALSVSTRGRISYYFCRMEIDCLDSRRRLQIRFFYIEINFAQNLFQLIVWVPRVTTVAASWIQFLLKIILNQPESSACYWIFYSFIQYFFQVPFYSCLRRCIVEFCTILLFFPPRLRLINKKTEKIISINILLKKFPLRS